MQFYIRACSVFIFTFTLVFTPALHSSVPTTLKSSEHIFHYKATTADERFAREIVDLLNSTRRYRTNLRATRNLIRLKSQTDAFDDFHQLVSIIHGIYSNRLTHNNFHNYCNFTKHEDLSPIAQNLESNIISFCHNQLGTLLRENRPNSNDIDYIRVHITDFLAPRHQSDLSNILSSIDKESSMFIQLSEMIIDHLVNHSIHPQEQLIENLYINAKLTNHIQELGHADPSANRYFTSEFNQLTTNSRESIEANKINDALNYFNQALSFYQQNRKYIPASQASRNFLFIGQDLVRSSQFDHAKHIYSNAGKLFTGSTHNDFVFQLLWADIIRDEYQLAERTLNHHKILTNLNDYNTRIKYWTAKVLKKQNRRAQAISIYENIITDDPMTYYAILASKDLTRVNPDNPLIQRYLATSISAPEKYINHQRTDYSDYFRAAVARVNIWPKLGMGHWSYDEINHLLSSNIKSHLTNDNLSQSISGQLLKKQLIRDFTYALNSHQEFLQTFRLVNNSLRSGTITMADINLNDLFPLAYSGDIQGVSTNVDPIIILSLIRQESAFNPKAISSAGARGLMQLMPATARMLQRNVRPRQLEDPQLNIRLGIQYFSKRLNQYEGDLIFTLASYNAGAHRVNRWRAEVFQHDDPLKIIETIPFRETRNYVKFIYRNMFFYRLINEEINLNQSIADSFRVSSYSATN